MGTAPGIWNDILVAPLLHRCGIVVIDNTQAVSTPGNAGLGFVGASRPLAPAQFFRSFSEFLVAHGVGH